MAKIGGFLRVNPMRVVPGMRPLLNTPIGTSGGRELHVVNADGLKSGARVRGMDTEKPYQHRHGCVIVTRHSLWKEKESLFSEHENQCGFSRSF